MKKTKKINLGLKSIQLTFIALLSMLIFYSCSKEDDSINKSGKIDNKDKLDENNSKDKSKVIIGGGDLIQANVNSYSQAIFSNYENLGDALNQNLYIGFNAQAIQMLNNAQNENDIKLVLESAGIANSQEVIDILKNIVEVQQTFIADNRNFYNLTQEQQVEYLNSSVETAKNNFILSNPPVAPTVPMATFPGCLHSFNTGIDRCNGDFGTCAVFAVAGAYAGLAPGLLAAAYCMVTKVTCDKRVRQDFKDCEAQEYVHGVPGPEAILTLNCTAGRVSTVDSCWTTYNGAYFGRVNL